MEVRLIATTLATNYLPKCFIIVIPSVSEVARNKLHLLFLYEKDKHKAYILVTYKWPARKLLVRLELHLPGFSFWSSGVYSLPLPLPLHHTKYFFYSQTLEKNIFGLYNCIVCIGHQIFLCVLWVIWSILLHIAIFITQMLYVFQCWMLCSELVDQTVCVEQSEYKLKFCC